MLTRRLLEALNPNDAHGQTPEAFDDGEALFEVVCKPGLEGVVAKARRRAVTGHESAAG